MREDGLACSRLASRRCPACGVTQKRYGRAGPEVGMSFTHANGTEVRPKRRCARMKVLIGVDPHKASVAVAVVDEAKGELVERASFPQNRAGLRSIEDAGRNVSPSAVGRLRLWRPRGRHLAGRLAAAGESVVDVPRPSSRHGCGCSRASLATPARTMGSMLSPPPWPPRAPSDWQRSIPRSARRRCACFLRGARTWSPGVPEHSRQPARASAGPPPRRGSRDALSPPSRAHLARHTTPGRRLVQPPPRVGLGDPARHPDAR